MSNHFTITGNVGQDPELRFTPSGDAVVNLSVADTPRRFNQDTKEWEDAGETLWVRVAAWKDKAEAIAESVHKGDRIVVVGRLKQRTWQDNNGNARLSIECDAESVSVVPKASGSRQQQPQSGGGWGGGQQQQRSQGRASSGGSQQRRSGGSSQQSVSGQWGGGSGDYDQPPF